ncbi:MAG: hypothetical protein IJ520_02330 [Synergistaceae bacterium]|nr:hypothetical protein [Synergistaceae bacterium]
MADLTNPNSHVTKANLAAVMTGVGELNDARFLKNADKGALATLDEVAKAQLSSALSAEITGKADSSTTLAGYGIADAYTKSEIDAKITATYKPKGSLAASGIAASLLVAANEGNVYNITEDFTSTADFVEGAGNTHTAGTNVVVVNTVADGETAVYKFDVMAGMVDLSGYATKDEVAALTAQDVQDIIDGTYAA